MPLPRGFFSTGPGRAAGRLRGAMALSPVQVLASALYTLLKFIFFMSLEPTAHARFR